MRCVILVGALSLVATAAGAQTTWCNRVGTMVMCNTTPAPQPNPAYAQAQANFDGAAGAALGSMFANIVEQARERREAKRRIRSWALDAARTGDCLVARGYAEADAKLAQEVGRLCPAPTTSAVP